VKEFVVNDNKIMKLFDRVQYMDESDLAQFEDDLPYFVKSLTKSELIKMLDAVENNIVEKDDAMCHIYTIHSYKGLESPIVKLADDISVKELNLYYVALTRATEVILY
jgi:ATP-dependent exoDNAse (exonuclease V) beta subunit